jgi:hypothetical protein
VAIWLSGQIVDATVIEGRRPRLNAGEKAIVRAGGTPSGWLRARARRIDRVGLWIIRTRAICPATRGATNFTCIHECIVRGDRAEHLLDPRDAEREKSWRNNDTEHTGEELSLWHRPSDVVRWRLCRMSVVHSRSIAVRGRRRID